MMQIHFICIFFSVHILNIINCLKYKFFEITAFNQRERQALYAIYGKEKTIYFLNGISNEAAIPINVALEDRNAHTFEMRLLASNIQYVYFTEEVMSKSTTNVINVCNSFLQWDEITMWVDTIMKKNKNIQKIVIAKTFERRDIFILKVSNGVKNPIVFIVGSEDGKDWISSSVILNFLLKLVDENAIDNGLLKNFDFYLVPVLNPDGFVYSKTYDRFWSKNRKEFFPPISCSNNSDAVGVNIDRNWFHNKAPKLMQDECKNIYVGREPLSEEETQTLSYVLNSLAINMMAFINLKDFGKFITIPYAYKEPTINHDIVMDILISAVTSVNKMYNETYYVDTSNRLIYNSSGNMADWVKRKLNIPIVFTQYLGYKKVVLTKSNHISKITQQFYTTLNETLTVAKDIYGPIFNSQRMIYGYGGTKCNMFCLYTLLRLTLYYF